MDIENTIKIIAGLSKRNFELEKEVKELKQIIDLLNK